MIEIDAGSPLEIQKLQCGLSKIADGEGTAFVAGKGKHRPQLQQLYEELEECGKRLMHYKGCFEIMGKTGTIIQRRIWKVYLCCLQIGW